jgi:hypothetical protein
MRRRIRGRESILGLSSDDSMSFFGASCGERKLKRFPTPFLVPCQPLLGVTVGQTMTNEST